MGKKKKQYQKPIVEKVNLRVTESVLTACKTIDTITQPNATRKCSAGGAAACKTTDGS